MYAYFVFTGLIYAVCIALVCIAIALVIAALVLRRETSQAESEAQALAQAEFNNGSYWKN